LTRLLPEEGQSEEKEGEIGRMMRGRRRKTYSLPIDRISLSIKAMM
jgi:hypothetical protein